jgi:hypothetical protein
MASLVKYAVSAVGVTPRLLSLKLSVETCQGKFDSTLRPAVKTAIAIALGDGAA